MGGRTWNPRPVVHCDKGRIFFRHIVEDAACDDDNQYTNNYKRSDASVAQKIMYVGNGTKSLHISIEASLKKLRTSYIDLFYVHWWDYETSIEEVMRSLHTLILARKVLYLVSHLTQ